MNKFKTLCNLLENMKNPKEARDQIADYLKELSPEDQIIACNFMLGKPLENEAVGYSKRTVEYVLDKQYPDNTHKKYETLGDMCHNMCYVSSNLILSEVRNMFNDLSETIKEKKDYLNDELMYFDDLEKKYFINILLNKLRVRIGMGVISHSLEYIYGVDYKYINNLYKKYESITDVINILNAGIDEIRIGKPVKPQLAKDVTLKMDVLKFPLISQPKLDGIRGQIHIHEDGRVQIFSRSLKDKTNSFPDIVEQVKNLPVGIYDSELYGINSDSSLMKFHQFQHRINNIKNININEYPVTLKIFDVLHYGGKDVTMLTQIERRKIIEHFDLVLDEVIINNKEEIIKYHKECVDLGFEGIVLKKMNGLYLPGQGKVSFKNWFKYKIANIRIDCLITGAEWGNGDKSSMLSSFNISVLDDTINPGESNLECSEISFKSIGKIGGGFTHAELKSITERMMKGIDKIEDYSYYEDPIILEIKAEKVMLDKNKKLGLRFPQLVFYREDKNITDLDTISMVLQYT